MILIDTCVWVDHFRRADPNVSTLVTEGIAQQHPFVTGELAVGTLRFRDRTLLFLRNLPQAHVVEETQIYDVVDDLDLAGIGVGFVDVHLLATLITMPDLLLWTRDRRLRVQAERLGVAYEPE